MKWSFLGEGQSLNEPIDLFISLPELPFKTLSTAFFAVDLGLKHVFRF